MFSSTTIASSTTNPVEIASAISERLSRLKPSRYMPPNVPTSESGTARLRGDTDGRCLIRRKALIGVVEGAGRRLVGYLALGPVRMGRIKRVAPRIKAFAEFI